ncbi:MAG TPA: SIS domain-containing protein [Planctomycetota bacterium]|nr:SIS domain-containing protein [Planctomycetota bacterium]
MRDDVSLKDSILRKCKESVETKQRFFEAEAGRIEACCRAMAERFAAGGRLFVFGNGGSSCDAQHISVEFMHPIIEKRPALPAIALGQENALVTAIGNDQDFSLAFVQQLRMLARAGDMALGISTSGKSANVNRALKEAREMGCLTVGFAGRDGGKMLEVCEFCFVVPSFAIHRIQECQETLLHVMWDLIHVVRGEEDVI